MPNFKSRMVFEMVRNIKVFLNLEAGLTRGEVPGPEFEKVQEQELRQARQKIAKQNQQIANKDRKIAELQRELAEGGVGTLKGSIRPENMIWIFGTRRCGSTWLMNMMATIPQTSYWNEPKVGKLFGEFYENAQAGELNARNFILGEPAKEGWVPLIREFVLGSIRYRRPSVSPNAYLVVKEPSASVGAPLILEALPESRVILLIRDPRDVVASVLDAFRKGSWLYERKDFGKRGEESLSDADPDAAVRLTAERYLRDVNNARRAYETHRGPKVLVRYEELRTDALGTLRRIYSALKIPADEEGLAQAVEKHAWANIPEGDRGRGKKFRKATPGAWREDLTPEQALMVEEITAPLLEEFYPMRDRISGQAGSTKTRLFSYREEEK